jgi:HPt (histidine-containing phosphotransfer) domain-containing protein
MSGAAEMQVRLAELREAYVAGLSDLLARFSAAADRLDPPAREEMRDIAHRLAGTGSLYGFDELSAWGRAAERRVREGSATDVREVTVAFAVIVTSLR